MADGKLKHGGCLCGKVRYSLAGSVVYNVVCHCENCRRLTGSCFLTASIYPKDAFTIKSGTEYVKTYIDTATESGTPLMRNFCSECGSQLFATTALNDQIVSLYVGGMDELGEWKPTKEQFCSNKAAWVPELKDVQRHITGPQSAAPESI